MSDTCTFLQGGTGAVERTCQDKMRERVSPEDFGAVGDGVTNDTDAFAAMAAYINTLGGGVIDLAAKVYIVGKQDFAGATGLGYAYRRRPILQITNCPRPVVINGNGAVLKAADSLRYGSFDPVTGEPYTPPSGGFVDPDYAADAYDMVETQSNASVSIHDLECDGNIAGLIVGGPWGDSGYQLRATGVSSRDNKAGMLANIYAHHCALDGVTVAWNSTNADDPPNPHALVNVDSEYNGRQALSWIGGRKLTAINCKFNHTGRGGLSSTPGAGVDIEPNAGLVNRDGLFMNCEFVDNVGPGMQSAGVDVDGASFHRCRFVGTSTTPVWVAHKNFAFHGCEFVGAVTRLYGDASAPAEATRFDHCLFTDDVDASYGGDVYVNQYLIGASGAAGVRIEGGELVATRSRLAFVPDAVLAGCMLRLQAGADYLATGGVVLSANGATLREVRIVDEIADPPSSHHYLALSTTTVIGQGVAIDSPNGNITLSASSTYTGPLAATPGASQTYLSINRLRTVYGEQGIVRIFSSSAVPAGTSFSFQVGDIVLNQNPVAGGSIGWVCITAGAPGAWKTWGGISS